MLKKRFFLTSIGIFFLLSYSALLFGKTEWQTLAPGLLYTTINIDQEDNISGKLHAFQIDLNQYYLESVSANSLNKNSASVENLTKSVNGLIGINGGFFNPGQQMLGLRVQNGKILNPIRPITWWHIFFIAHHKPYLVEPLNFNVNNNIEFAIQAGPRLVVQGKVLSTLKPGVDARSAIGMTRDNKIILAATEDISLSTDALAKILSRSSQQDGLECYNALNLDGGSSTQLYAKVGMFELNVPNFNTIADAIVVAPIPAKTG